MELFWTLLQRHRQLASAAVVSGVHDSLTELLSSRDLAPLRDGVARRCVAELRSPTASGMRTHAMHVLRKVLACWPTEKEREQELERAKLRAADAAGQAVREEARKAQEAALKAVEESIAALEEGKDGGEGKQGGGEAEEKGEGKDGGDQPSAVLAETAEEIEARAMAASVAAAEGVSLPDVELRSSYVTRLDSEVGLVDLFFSLLADHGVAPSEEMEAGLVPPSPSATPVPKSPELGSGAGSGKDAGESKESPPSSPAAGAAVAGAGVGGSGGRGGAGGADGDDAGAVNVAKERLELLAFMLRHSPLEMSPEQVSGPRVQRPSSQTLPLTPPPSLPPGHPSLGSLRGQRPRQAARARLRVVRPRGGPPRRAVLDHDGRVHADALRGPHVGA